MLPKFQRLNLKKDFQWVAETDLKLNTKYLKLFIKYGGNVFPRIGIAVSGKTFKKAHERNRAKRLVAEAFQSTAYRLPPTANIVALPKVSILGVKSGTVLLDLEQVLKYEKIID